MKVVIIGGGAIGMMQARDLALKGQDVLLLERHNTGQEASWAGGGIVSPLYPWRYSPAVTRLAQWSQSYYPNLAQSLEAESDIDPQLTKHGLLVLDLDDRADAEQWAAHNAAWMQSLTSAETYELEPHLREGVQGALWMPQVSSIRNPRLLSALRKCLERLPNVEIREHAPVSEFVVSNARVNGLILADGETITGDAFVVCAGSWSTELLGLPALKVEPVKGQMLLFEAEPGVVNRVVLSNGKYVIPRRDGSVLAGSTLEHTGFEKTTTEQAKTLLADMAIDLYPELARYPISHHWAGLRPAAPEGIPYIGPVPDRENLFINAGHFRNGLVLAPASVALMSALLCHEPLPFDAEDYLPKNRLDQ